MEYAILAEVMNQAESYGMGMVQNLEELCVVCYGAESENELYTTCFQSSLI